MQKLPQLDAQTKQSGLSHASTNDSCYSNQTAVVSCSCECLMETKSGALQRYRLEVDDNEVRVLGLKRGNVKLAYNLMSIHARKGGKFTIKTDQPLSGSCNS